MDTDKNGKVSKEEFMHFMEAEFDFADTDKNGELDPKELLRFQNRLSHPLGGPGR
jgi:Ca2+-binding EF-hand superfamily protein